MVIEACEILRAPPGDRSHEPIDALRDAQQRLFDALEMARMDLQHIDHPPQSLFHAAEPLVGLLRRPLQALKPPDRQVDYRHTRTVERQCRRDKESGSFIASSARPRCRIALRAGADHRAAAAGGQRAAIDAGALCRDRSTR